MSIPDDASLMTCGQELPKRTGERGRPTIQRYMPRLLNIGNAGVLVFDTFEMNFRLAKRNSRIKVLVNKQSDPTQPGFIKLQCGLKVTNPDLRDDAINHHSEPVDKAQSSKRAMRPEASFNRSAAIGQFSDW